MRRAAFALALTLLVSCRCDEGRERPEPSRAASSLASPARSAEPSRPLVPLSAPVFHDLPGPRGFGMPSGCKLLLPIREAELPPNTQFIAAESVLDELALAVPERAGSSSVVARGLFRPGQPAIRDVPWSDLRAPPALGSDDHTWIGAYVDTAPAEPWTVRLWQGPDRLTTLASGDQLRVFDLNCSAGRCALLTSLVGKTLLPGASLFVGAASEPGTHWKRIDVRAPPEQSWQPFALLGLPIGGKPGRLLLSNPEALAIWEYTSKSARKLGEHAAPFGVYAVIRANDPWLIAPGKRTDAPCTEDSFPINVAKFGGSVLRFTTRAPPQRLIARPLAQGGLVVWLATVSCRSKRRVVYALHVGPEGTALGSPMSIADASGFAVATRGDQVSLWLRRASGLAWLRATCAP